MIDLVPAVPLIRSPQYRGLYKDASDAFALSKLATFAENALPLFEELSSPSVPSLEDPSAPSSPVLRGSGVQPNYCSSCRNEEDIWSDLASLAPLKHETRLVTWSSFYKAQRFDPQHQVPQEACLISEAGHAAFNAALAGHARASDNGQEGGRPVRIVSGLNSLFELGLGRSSSLFRYENGLFENVIDDAKLSGTSLLASSSVLEQFRDLGGATVRLRALADDLQANEKVCTGFKALASCIHTVLDAIEVHCVEKRSRMRSVIQLQELFERPQALIHLLGDMSSRLKEKAEARDGSLVFLTDDVLVAAAFKYIEELEGLGQSTHVVRLIFDRLSRSWLDSLEEYVGIKRSTTGNVLIANSCYMEDDFVVAVQGPAQGSVFLPEEFVSIVRETSTLR